MEDLLHTMHNATGAKGPSQFSHAYKKLHAEFEDTKFSCPISDNEMHEESGDL
jgi:hypothetical protein